MRVGSGEWFYDFYATTINMKFALGMLAVNLASVVCVGVAAYLAAHDKAGWGWFLFAAVILTGSLKMSDSKSS